MSDGISSAEQIDTKPWKQLELRPSERLELHDDSPCYAMLVEEDASQTAMNDSGANISIACFGFAIYHGRVIKELDEPITVSGHKLNSTITICFYADFGPIIGRVYLTNMASTAIISVASFVDRGWTVSFTQDDMRVMHPCGAILYRGTRQTGNRLWYLNITEILKHESIDAIVQRYEMMGGRDTPSIAFMAIRERKQLMAATRMIAHSSAAYPRRSDDEEDDEEEGDRRNQPQSPNKRKAEEKIDMEMIREMIKLHENHGHMSQAQMLEAVEARAFDGISPRITVFAVNAFYRKYGCIICRLVNHRRANQKPGTGVSYMVRARVLAMDYLGLYRPTTTYRADGGFLFECLATGYLNGILTNKKTSFIDAVKQVARFFMTHGHIVRKLQTDFDGVANSAETKEELAKMGIEVIPCSPDEQNQDPLERRVQTVWRTMGAMMMNQKVLTKRHWGLCWLAAIDILNKLMSKRSRAFGCTPMEAIIGIKPRPNRFRFGTLLISLKQEYRTEKLGSVKSELAVAVGEQLPPGVGIWVIIKGKTSLTPSMRYQVRPVTTMHRQTTEQELLDSYVDEEVEFEEDGQKYTMVRETMVKEDFEGTDFPNNSMQALPVPETGWGRLQTESRQEGDDTDAREEDDIMSPRVPSAPAVVEEVLPERVSVSESVSHQSIPEEKRNPLIGRQIRKDFGAKHGGFFTGEVESYKRPYYSIYYQQDDDREDMKEAQVRELLVPLSANVVMMAEDVEDDDDSETESESGYDDDDNVTSFWQANAALGGTAWGADPRCTQTTLRGRQIVMQTLGANDQRGTILSREGGMYWVRLDDGDTIQMSYDEIKPILLEQNRISNLVQVISAYVGKTVHRTEDNPLYQHVVRDQALWEYWSDAIGMEQDSFEACLEQVALADIPFGQQILTTMVDLRTKRDQVTNEIKKLKARFNVRGNEQVKESSTPTYAPTANTRSMMLLFASVMILGWSISGFDVVNCFKNTPYEGPTQYLTMPSELTDGIKKYYKILKALHGMREASRLWFDFFGKHLKEKAGMSQSIADPSVFYKWDGDRCVILVLHTDDGAICTNDPQMARELKDIIRQLVDITESVNLEDYIGIHIHYNANGSMTLTTPANTRKLIAATYPDPTAIPRNVFNPMRDDFTLYKAERDERLCDEERYQRIIGLAIFETKCRKEIVPAVSILSSFTHAPTFEHMEALEHLVAYIANAEDIGLTFHPGTDTSAKFVELAYWCDASMRTDDDGNARYGSGVKVVQAGSDPLESLSGFASVSSKQDGSTTVPLAVSEGELHAVKDIVKDAYADRLLFQEVGLLADGPSMVYTDSQPVTTITGVQHANSRRMRHLHQERQFIQQAALREVIKVINIKGTDQIIDAMTKPLTPIKHVRSLSSTMGHHESVDRFTLAYENRKRNVVNMMTQWEYDDEEEMLELELRLKDSRSNAAINQTQAWQAEGLGQRKLLTSIQLIAYQAKKST